MWRLYVWVWWMDLKHRLYEVTHAKADDGHSFREEFELDKDFSKGFWKNGHFVKQTKDGIVHFDDNCPQERDARILASSGHVNYYSEEYLNESLRLHVQPATQPKGLPVRRADYGSYA